MALLKSTNYAPDIYKALSGIIVACKPSGLRTRDMNSEIRGRLCDELNRLKPRPLSKRLVISGEIDEKKSIVEVPNLADHPLVVGPRYLPWELQLNSMPPHLSSRASGVSILLLGKANYFYFMKMRRARLVNVYHLEGQFGYITDNFYHDGKIIDKTTFSHIRPNRIDSALARIESSQHERLFDSAKVDIHSKEAYELAKAWPSRPPRMADWPVIYRLRCIHFSLPNFKIEAIVTNENDQFLVQLIHDIGLMLKSGAHTKSIRRVKFGPFDINESLTDKDWNIQSIIDHTKLMDLRRSEIHDTLRQHTQAMKIGTEFKFQDNPQGQEDGESKSQWLRQA